MGLLILTALCPLAAATPRREGPRGLPPTRSYSFAEIGNLSPGVQLSLDPLGRLLVVQQGEYYVFDDENWKEITILRDSDADLGAVLRGPDGTTYFASVASWGTLEHVGDTAVRLRPQKPATVPDWASNNGFERMALDATGVCFAGRSGLVHWNPTTGRNTFFALPGLTSIFPLQGSVYASSTTGGLVRVNAAANELEPVPGKRVVFEAALPWDAEHVLGWSREEGFALFDGKRTTPWQSDMDGQWGQGISELVALGDGRFAALAKGRGVYVLNRNGRCELALAGSVHSDTVDMCAGEPGVLWLTGGRSVTKVLYDLPISLFDQRLGLTVFWPWVGWHEGRLLVLSDGRLYEPIDGNVIEPMRFREVPLPLEYGAQAVAATSHGLLVGDHVGTYLRKHDGTLEPVTSGFSADRMVTLAADRCLILGRDRIALLGWDGTRWRVVGEPIPGVGFASQVVTVPGRSVWLELGVNRVARVAWDGDQPTCRVFTPFPRKNPTWLNLGLVGNVAIISHTDGSRLYFDEARGTFVDAPELDRTLKSGPYVALRPMQAADGVIWMPHARGVYRLVPNPAGGYTVDTGQFDAIRESYPIVQIAGDDEIWLSSQRSLTRLLASPPRSEAQPPRPVLTSIVDARSKRVLYNAIQPDPGALLDIPHRSNSLNFTFLPGTFRRLRPADYQFRLTGYSDEWSLPISGSTISLTRLAAGDYEMSVRLADSTGPVGEPVSFTFSIATPLYRRWYALVAYAILIGGGHFLASRWWLRRTARRKARLEKLVAARTEELRVAVEAGEIGRWRWNVATGQFTLTPQARRIFGVSGRQELTYPVFLFLLHPDDRLAADEALQDAIARKQECKLEVRSLWPDHSVRWINFVGRPHYDDSGKPLRMEGVAVDVTDRERAERDRLMFGKLESTGLLAGGIAHDFNNLLAGVLLNVELAQEGSPEEMHQALRSTAGAIRTASELTRKLVTLSSGGLYSREPIDVEALLKEAVQRWSSRSGARVTLAPAAEPHRVSGDRELLAVAIGNLLTNAHEASPREAEVRVEVSQQDLAESAVVTLPAGRYVRVSVIDAGPGIPLEVLPRIFDPYFSTKQRGTQKGMGLGLTVVMSVAQRHGGVVTVESAPGDGARFHLYLPLAQTPPQPAPEGSIPPFDGPLSILVMDDEPALRDVLARTLASLGHEAATTADSTACIERYVQARDRGRPFDLVILDLVVPGSAGGEDTLRALRAVDADVRAVMMSGYATNSVLVDYEIRGFKGALAKPFTREKLSATLARARSG